MAADAGSRTARVLAEGIGFVEGPVVDGDRVLVTSISHGRIYAVDAAGARPFATTGGGPNGAAAGGDGSLFVAQNGGHLKEKRPDPATGPLGMAGGVQRVSPTGEVDWVTLYPATPNDLCFGPDGMLYVTDPTRGRHDDSRIWRCDPATGLSDLLVSVDWYANGVGFGAEDDALYVASTSGRSIVRYALDDGRLSAPETVLRLDHNQPDGFAFDADGNITIATFSLDGRHGDVQTWSLDGELLDVLDVGPTAILTNVALTADRRLIVADGTRETVLAIDGWPAAPLPLHPFRT